MRAAALMVEFFRTSRAASARRAARAPSGCTRSLLAHRSRRRRARTTWTCCCRCRARSRQGAVRARRLRHQPGRRPRSSNSATSTSAHSSSGKSFHGPGALDDSIATPSDLVTLTINGREVKVPKGTLVVEAAKQVGIEIPIFCYHPKLKPVGACRMCLVEIEKMPRLQTACTSPVGRGHGRAHQHARRSIAAQNGVLELLLANHPLDCPICDKGGECPLQDNTFKFGLGVIALHRGEAPEGQGVTRSRDRIVLDRERCIMCYRCVRFQPGDPRRRGAGGGRPRRRTARSACSTGETYDSLFSRQHHRAVPGRRADQPPVPLQGPTLGPGSGRRRVCAGCAVGCNIEVHTRDGQILRAVGPREPGGQRRLAVRHGPLRHAALLPRSRVTQPMVRQGGALASRPSWDAAYARAAELLDAGRRRAGLRRRCPTRRSGCCRALGPACPAAASASARARPPLAGDAARLPNLPPCKTHRAGRLRRLDRAARSWRCGSARPCVNGATPVVDRPGERPVPRHGPLAAVRPARRSGSSSSCSPPVSAWPTSTRSLHRRPRRTASSDRRGDRGGGRCVGDRARWRCWSTLAWRRSAARARPGAAGRGARRIDRDAAWSARHCSAANGRGAPTWPATSSRPTARPQRRCEGSDRVLSPCCCSATRPGRARPARRVRCSRPRAPVRTTDDPRGCGAADGAPVRAGRARSPTSKVGSAARPAALPPPGVPSDWQHAGRPGREARRLGAARPEVDPRCLAEAHSALELPETCDAVPRRCDADAGRVAELDDRRHPLAGHHLRPADRHGVHDLVRAPRHQPPPGPHRSEPRRLGRACCSRSPTR